MTTARIKGIVALSAVLWLSSIGVGLRLISNYENSPGNEGVPPSEWPAESLIERTAGQATLVMLAHPQCPCTRASIGELALLMARCQGRVSAYVLFLRSPELPAEWEQTELWRSAKRIPGVTVLSDEEGRESARFNATTSGATLLYDVEGRLLFSGGITGSRGHSGDNHGRSAIVALLNQQTAGLSRTPVFGCSLVNEPDGRITGDERCTK